MKSTALARAASSEKQWRIFIPGWFRDGFLRELKGAPYAVYSVYVSRRDKPGKAWPTLRSLQATTGYGINQIKRARKKLVDVGLLIPLPQERPGGEFGLKAFLVRIVAPKQCHGTVAPSTVAPSTVAPSTLAPQECHKGSPSEVVEFEGTPKGKGSSTDAVRRPSDAGRLAGEPSFLQSQKQSQKQNVPFREKQKPSQKQIRTTKLNQRLEGKIAHEDDTYGAYIDWCLRNGEDSPFGPDEKAAFYGVEYDPDLRDPLLSRDFVDTVVAVYEKAKDKEISPGNLCSKIIDECMRQKRSNEKLGIEAGHNWPPAFQKHRDQLRVREEAWKASVQKRQLEREGS